MPLNVFLAFCILGIGFMIYAFFQWTYGDKRRTPACQTAHKNGLDQEQSMEAEFDRLDKAKTGQLDVKVINAIEIASKPVRNCGEIAQSRHSGLFMTDEEKRVLKELIKALCDGICISSSYEQLMDAHLNEWRAEADVIRKSLEFQAFSDAIEEKRDTLDMLIEQNDWILLLKTLPRRSPLH